MYNVVEMFIFCIMNIWDDSIFTTTRGYLMHIYLIIELFVLVFVCMHKNAVHIQQQEATEVWNCLLQIGLVK